MIPVAEPRIGDPELEYVIKCVKSGWISSLGEYIAQFEEAFAQYCDARYAISTSNGTTALHLSLHASGIGPGDEVIVPSLTFVASANAVMYTGATPVFVDSEPLTWNIDVHQIEAQITDRTRAIMAVHLYGHPCDMDAILALAERYDLLVLEDAAEALGARYKGRMIGNLGHAASFSFYGNKIITTGEGGMVVTNDEALANRCRFLRDHAMSAEKRYWHDELGFNYRLTNIQAAIGLAQLRQISEFLQLKRRNAALYTSLLSDIKCLSLAPQENWSDSSFWLYSILVQDNAPVTRDVLMVKLRESGIDTRPVFHPMHAFPMYRKLYPELTLPVAEEIARQGMSLPSAVTLSTQQLEYISDTLHTILKA